MLTPMYFLYGDVLLHVCTKKLQFQTLIKHMYTKYVYGKSEAVTSSTHSFAFISTFQKKCFVKNCKTLQFHLPYFQSDLHQIFTVLFDFFYSCC